MIHSKIVFLLSCVLPISLFSAEPSAFGAGDLTSSNPYGLTSKEKVILDTKKKLHKVAVKSNNQANELDSLRERIDGLQSIIESLSRKAHNNRINLKRFSETSLESSKNSNDYEKRLSDIIEKNSESIAQQKIVMSEMSSLVDSINAQYVSKSEFNSLVNDVNAFKMLVAKELKHKSKQNSSSKSKFSSMSSAEVYKKANAFYKKKYYTNAIENFEYLIKKNYKPAYAHYMIGEMNYKRKNYSDAISYFKKSSSLYSKASYMPKLMLHTAISMKKSGDTNHANTFFKAVIGNYPDSAEAKEAKKYIQQ